MKKRESQRAQLRSMVISPAKNWDLNSFCKFVRNRAKNFTSLMQTNGLYHQRAKPFAKHTNG